MVVAADDGFFRRDVRMGEESKKRFGNVCLAVSGVGSAVGRGQHGTQAADGPAFVQKFHRQIDHRLRAMAHEQTPVAGELTDIAGRQAEMTGAFENGRRLGRRHRQDHAFLRFGEPDFPRLEPGVFAVNGGEVDGNTGGFTQFANRGRQSARPAIGQGADQRVGTVEQLDKQVGHQPFYDRVADLHGGPGHFARRGVHGHGRKGRPADPVASGRPADDQNTVSGLRPAQFVIAPEHLADATAEDERIGGVTGIVKDGTGHGGHAHFVAVVGYPLDHSLLDDRGVEHAIRQIVMVEFARTEAKDVGQGHRAGGSSKDVADHATHPGIGSAKGLDCTRVVVRFGLDGEPHTVGKSHDTGVAVEGGDDERSLHCACRLAQLAQEGHDLALIGLDACGKGLVGTVVTPGLRDGFQFGVGRITSFGREPLRHGLHFFGVEGESTFVVDPGQPLRRQSAQRDNFSRGRFFGRRRGESGLHLTEGPCLDDWIAEKVVNKKAEIFFRKFACAGHFEARSRGGFDPASAARRALSQLCGHAVGHTGPPCHLDDETAGRHGGCADLEAGGFAMGIVKQSRYNEAQIHGIRFPAQKKDVRGLEGNTGEPELPGLPGQRAVAMCPAWLDHLGEGSPGCSERRVFHGRANVAMTVGSKACSATWIRACRVSAVSSGLTSTSCCAMISPVSTPWST